MTRKADVDDFIAQKKLAVAGVSRKKGKFGNAIFRELKKAGYEVFALNPNSETVEGEKCYPNVKALPEPVDGLVMVLPPAQTEKVVQDAVEAGIKRIWMQLGAHSDAAIQMCKDNGITVIYKECLLMFIEPVTSIHGFHRWLRKVFGKLPA
ncbi:MAG: CoA-binding protein [bacterium]|nr:CoA-binding protein [bacterium]